MANELNSSKSDLNKQRTALNRAIDTASAAPDESEDGYVIKRLSEALADIIVTIRGDDAPLADEPTNHIEKAKRAAKLLRLEVELYRSQAQAAAPAKAREPNQVYVEVRQCGHCGHISINDGHATDAACGYSCGWSGPSPAEDKCPGCGVTNWMGVACPKCSGLYEWLADGRFPADEISASAPAMAAETVAIRNAALEEKS